jgi:hypothetical protein
MVSQGTYSHLVHPWCCLSLKETKGLSCFWLWCGSGYTSYLHSNSTQPSSYAHWVFNPCVLCHGCEEFLLQVKPGYVPLYFPNLHEEERRIMKSFLYGRSTLGPNGLEVMDTLDRLLTLPFNINALTNPNY